MKDFWRYETTRVKSKSYGKFDFIYKTTVTPNNINTFIEIKRSVLCRQCSGVYFRYGYSKI